MLASALIAFTLSGLGTATGVWFLLPRELDDRLSSVEARPRSRGTLMTYVARLDYVFGRWLERRMGPRWVASVERRLIAAGVLGRQAVYDHLGRRVTYMVLGAVLGALILFRSGNPLILLLSLLAAWLLSDGALNAAVRRRTNRIENDLPDFLDVVAVMLSAGLGFREALRRVADAMPGPVAEEIDYVLRQFDLGVPRREAFTELRGRNESEAFDKFVAALLQAEELGTPLSDAMIALAEDIRRDAAQTARRRAAQAAPRVSFVLTMFIVPASLALLLVGLMFGSEIDLGEIFPS